MPSNSDNSKNSIISENSVNSIISILSVNSVNSGISVNSVSSVNSVNSVNSGNSVDSDDFCRSPPQKRRRSEPLKECAMRKQFEHHQEFANLQQLQCQLHEQ